MAVELIALSGYARSGKDEAAKILVEEYGFTRVAFADKLREFLYALDPIVSYSGWMVKDKGSSFGWREVESSPETYVTVRNVIDVYTWDNYKETQYGAEIRRLLQRLGTEAGRDVLGENTWIDAALDNVDSDKIVVTDCRFPNEAQAIKDRRGRVWRVNRAGTGPAVGADGVVHSSETSLDDYHFDRLLYNDGSLKTYQDIVRRTYEGGN